MRDFNDDISVRDDLVGNRLYSVNQIIIMWLIAILTIILPGINIPNAVAGELKQLNYFPTWDGGIISSTDASGICYHEPSGHLFIADAEINENPEWDGVNIFETSLRGDVLFASYDSYGRNFYREPTGITYNQYDGYFYITNDNTRDIYRYDDTFGNYIAYVHIRDDVPDSGDPEGITSDPATGFLYVMEGVGGGNQVLVYSSTLQFLYRFYIDPGIEDANGIAFNPITNHLLIVSKQSGPDFLFEYTLDGTYVDEYSLGDLSPSTIKPYGVVFAPPSDPYSNPYDLSLYIVDMGRNNLPDGAVYEVRLCAATSCLCEPTGFADDNCNGIDDDCDGQIDEDAVCNREEANCFDGRDDDSDGLFDCEDPDCAGSKDGSCDTLQPGICSFGTWTCQNGANVCMADNQPQVEVCDYLDNDCDGNIDEGFDADNDGYSICNGDCNDNDTDINPSACDIKYDGIDQDCDGVDRTRGKWCKGVAIDPEICDDGADNDRDGKIDCEDKKDCKKDPAC